MPRLPAYGSGKFYLFQAVNLSCECSPKGWVTKNGGILVVACRELALSPQNENPKYAQNTASLKQFPNWVDNDCACVCG